MVMILISQDTEVLSTYDNASGVAQSSNDYALSQKTPDIKLNIVECANDFVTSNERSQSKL